MPGGAGDEFDFFLSRRGSVAAIAQEVANVLTDEKYKVIVQDYDIPLGASFIEKMHEAIKNSRDLVILFTGDYEASPFTRKEFTSFEADRYHGRPDRQIVVLRCEDVPLRGLLADTVYQDLVGITDPEERKRRIIAAAERRSPEDRPQRRRGRTFVGVPPRIAGFTGRVEALDRLDASLTRDKPAAVTQVGRAAVQGMGGVGKTSLAVEYAHRFRNLYDGVWWCPAETWAGLMTSLAALATEFEVAAPDEADIEKAAKAALRRLAEQQEIWLLVYDNVAAPEEIAGLLPTGGARVLITSRFSDWSEWADEVSLDVLPIEEAMVFLQDRAGRRDEVGARTLAEALGRLPLALDHAAATCKRTQMSFAAYATKASSLIAAAPRGVSYPDSVKATFDLAIDDAARQCPAAEAFMAFLAQCAPERIPMTLVEGAIDDEVERVQALAALSEVSLVKHDPFEDGPPAVTVHRLVQAVARSRAEAKGIASDAFSGLLKKLVELYPEDGRDDPEGRTLQEMLTPHVIACSRIKITDPSANEKLAKIVLSAADYLSGSALYAEARSLYQRAITLSENLFGPEHPRTASGLYGLGRLLWKQNELNQARALLERALAIREAVLGSDHPDTAKSLDTLGGLLRLQDEPEKARVLLARGLAIRERVLGAEHPETADSLRSMGVLLLAQNDPQARPSFERSLAIFEKVYGPEHRKTAIALSDLASTLLRTGNAAEARPLYERAITIYERTFGPDHPDTATILHNLARLYRDEGRVPEAQSLFEKALARYEKTLGSEHSLTAGTLNSLGLLLKQNGDYTAARPLLERALKIREKVFGPDHTFTAESLYNLGSLLQVEGEFDEALTLYERALPISETRYGPDHHLTVAILSRLARLYLDQGDLVAAMGLAERAGIRFGHSEFE